MRFSLVGAAMVLAALSAGPADARYAGEEPPRLEVDPSLDRDIIAESELYCMTLAIFFEGGSTAESEEGQRHIARVISERAKANRRIWGGSSICGVVFYRAKGVCQFSFACLPGARRTPRQGPRWEFSEMIAREALEGRNESPDHLIRYYMNGELTSPRNACRFRKEFVPVVRAGRHEFFREPASWERRELAQTEFDECRRHAASLKAKKAKAKKALAKKGKAKQQIAKAKGKPKVARTKEARLKR
jgi:hypothetical protein